jgi:ribonucleoside-diphosphate reductase alpha chain
LSPDVVDPVLVSQKVVTGIFPGVKTSELDNLAAETAAYMSTIHPQYADLAARIAISNLQKEIPETFSQAMTLEYLNTNVKNGDRAPLLAEDVYRIIMKHARVLDDTIKRERDFNYDYFGFKTLERSYLVKVNKGTVAVKEDGTMDIKIEYRVG